MPLPTASPSSAALVTGASSGIGAEIARRLALRGHGVILVARREDRLRELADELTRQHDVRAETVGADLETEEGRDAMAAAVERLGLDVEVLVNNAGFGDSGRLHRAEREKLLRMVRLNCEALIDLQSRYVAPMVERGRGAVLNIASMAGMQPIPGTAAYAATKAFVLSLSEATHAELASSGVTVTAVCPGPVRTEFGEVAGVEEHHLPERYWATADDVAEEAISGAERGKRVVVPGGLINRVGALAGHHSPRAIQLPLTRRLWEGNT
ncbi:SDR family oxidoreductase [Thermoleophilia bacterium SCSIO 60948]|nr:SDR family oxidoreductase [Thermoleophilia bacterium SCSIO 60948]